MIAMTVRERVRSSSKVVNLTGNKAEFRFDRVSQDVTNMALWSDRFDFSKLELKIIWHFCALMPVNDGVQVLFETSIAEVAKDLRTDVGNVSRTIKRLVEQRILLRSDAKARTPRYGINTNVVEWTPLDELGDPIKSKSRRMAKHHASTMATHHEDHGKTPCPPWQSTMEPMATCHGEAWQNTMLTHGKLPCTASPNASGGALLPPPLDHGDHEETNHETERESLSVDEAIVSVDDLVAEAARLLIDGGYAVIPGRGATEPVGVFRQYVRNVLLSKSTDGKGFHVAPAEYLKEFIIPSLQECPKEFRGAFPQWSAKLNDHLFKSRALAFYITEWAGAKQTRAPHVAPVGSESDYAAVAGEMSGDALFG